MINAMKNNSGWRLGSIFLVGISLSIGWGIRGNYGHEYGAAFAGALGALTVVLVSGREDWQKRIPYFIFFGALGWGFGASVSYMMVLSYTESGQRLTQAYGYLALFYIGFLWAAMGGAGTAFAAVATKKRLVKIFRPLLFLWGAWLLLDLIEDPVAKLLQGGVVNFDDTWYRQKNPLYWFDADYLPALFALIGVWAYDLYNRKGEFNRFYLPLFAVGGAFSGWLVQYIMRVTRVENSFASALTYLQGDPAYINPSSGQQAYEASNLLNNWPQWFGDYPQHIGWFIGLILGIALYFILFGRFRNSSSLLAWMGSGWLISFLTFPVLGSLFFVEYGGLRMTPPRSDDWAGITGVFVATSIWMWRNNLKPVAVASLISGTIGGFGIVAMEWFKQLMVSFGSSRVLAAQGILPGSDAFNTITSEWSKWQSQNWHSFFEQTYGFVNGIAIAVALGFLAQRIKIHSDPETTGKGSGRWTRAFSVLFILLGLTYFNVVKNLADWSQNLDQTVWKQVITNANGTTETISAKWDLPILGRLPGFDFLHATPLVWFNLTWALLTAACIIIVVRHYRDPLSIIPKSPLAKGQLIFLILLWMMVVANFDKALTGWVPGRLLTEWTIFVNAILATVLVLLLPKENVMVTIHEEQNYKRVYNRLWIKAILVLFICSFFFWGTNQMIYHYYPKTDQQFEARYQTRFGPDATWKSHPNLKNGKSK